MNETIFKRRTKDIALRIIRLVQALPADRVSEVLGRQVLRSGTSVGANYRAACRGQSVKDVIRKLCIVEEEADETAYWLELMVESGLFAPRRLAGLRREVDEILAMTVASILTLRKSARVAASRKGRPKESLMEPFRGAQMAEDGMPRYGRMRARKGRGLEVPLARSVKKSSKFVSGEKRRSALAALPKSKIQNRKS